MTPTPARAPADDLFVLLFDDDDGVAARHAQALADAGQKVLRARTAGEAQALLDGHDVAVALVGAAALARGGAALPVPVVLVGEEDPAVEAPNVVAVLGADADGARIVRRIGAFTRLHAGTRTKLQAQRDELLRVLKFNAMMIAVLTHDLRTPMTAVTLSAEIVEKRAVHDTVKKAAGRIKASIARMSGTIGHLLNVASSRGGTTPVAALPGDLGQIGGEVVAEFLAARPDAQVTFEATGTTAGLFDAVRMSQVFSHLIGLAVEHGGAAAPVAVTVDGAHRSYLRIGVATSAVFPEEVQAGLFAEARSPGAPPGEPGPALAQVEDAVRAHGGTLVGHSDLVTGSMFDVMLPRLDGGPDDGDAAGAGEDRHDG